MTRAFDTGLRRTNRRIEHHLDRPDGGRARPASLTGALTVLALAPVRLVQNVIALTASLAVLVLLLVLGILGLGRLLTAYIGDSYVYLTDPGKLIERVHHDLDWLEWHANAPLVIVAHSQGAEIVRRVLVGRTSPVASLVTFGSGIEKLDAVARLRGQAWRGRLAILIRIVSAAALVAAIAGIVDAWPWWPVVLLLALSFGALSGARELMRRIVGPSYDHERLEIGPGQVSRWTDVYATSDPVSEGDLPVAGLGSSKQIVNRRLLLLDHTAYWENVERFRSNVALEIARVGGWNRPDRALARGVRGDGATRRARLGPLRRPLGDRPRRRRRRLTARRRARARRAGGGGGAVGAVVEPADEGRVPAAAVVSLVAK